MKRLVLQTPVFVTEERPVLSDRDLIKILLLIDTARMKQQFSHAAALFFQFFKLRQNCPGILDPQVGGKKDSGKDLLRQRTQERIFPAVAAKGATSFLLQ